MTFQSEVLRAPAWAITRSSVVLPILRAGVLMILSSETSSLGLSITRRYASRSFTSARS